MSNRKIARYGLFVSLFCLAGWVGSVSAAPKNIIVFIGDGMGPEHVRAAGYYYNGASGAFPFEGFPFQGYLTTYSADNAVTDSAAAGTALATQQGQQRRDQHGLSANADYPVQSEMLTLLEYFKAISKSTGLVSTAYLTDATPAAFGAHESSRSNTAQIAADFYTQTHPNVLLGGGGNGQSTAAAQTAGYTVVTTKTGLLGLNPETTGPVSGQFGSSDFPYFYDGYGTTYPRLAEMRGRILDNDRRVFSMVEAGGLTCRTRQRPPDDPGCQRTVRGCAGRHRLGGGRNDT
jgi:alkaline phosphatase